MNNSAEPELQEAFEALVIEFPKHGNRITPGEMPALCGVAAAILVRFDWISLRQSEGLGVYYAPSGQVLETIKTNNPNMGALAKNPKGRWLC